MKRYEVTIRIVLPPPRTLPPTVHSVTSSVSDTVEADRFTTTENGALLFWVDKRGGDRPRGIVKCTYAPGKWDRVIEVNLNKAEGEIDADNRRQTK